LQFAIVAILFVLENQFLQKVTQLIEDFTVHETLNADFDFIFFYLVIKQYGVDLVNQIGSDNVVIESQLPNIITLTLSQVVSKLLEHGMFGTEFEYFWVIFTLFLRSEGQLVVILGFTLLSYHSGVLQVVGEQQYFSSFSIIYLYF